MKLKFNLSQTEQPHARAVKNYTPLHETSPRIAFVADHPYDEEAEEPIGKSHRATLYYICKDLGININLCFMGCVVNFYPTSNHYKIHNKTRRFDVSNTEIIASLKKLEDDLISFNPDIIIFLGRDTLHLVKPGCGPVDEERGAPFSYACRDKTFLALPSYHPKECFVQYKLKTLLEMDIRKAHTMALQGWQPTNFDINYLPSFSEAIASLETYAKSRQPLVVDIETDGTVITCVGIAESGERAIVIPFFKENRMRYFSIEEELAIWRLLTDVLENNPLWGHNAVHYDHYVLAQYYGVNANYVEDSMYAWWERHQDTPKSLAFTNSVLTENSYWKSSLKDARSGKIPYWKEYEYCGKDCCINFQVLDKLKPERSSFHYRFNIATSRPFQYMSMLGAKLDLDKLKIRREELQEEALALAKEFSELSGHEHNNPFVSKSKGFSVRSTTKMKAWLYEELKLPKRFKLVKNNDGEKESRETADYLTLLYLGNLYPEHPAVLLAGKLRKLLKRISTLNSIQCRPDGIVGWSFNLVGTGSTRVAGYKPSDGFGVQPQNQDRRDRDLYLPALPGYRWYKADLEGADSWTVASQLASLGYPRMMTDLLNGLKPAQRSAIAEIAGWHLLEADVNELKKYLHLLKTPQGKPVYSKHKMVSHGTNYMMKKKTMHENIFRLTDGEMFVPEHECESIQRKLFEVYALPELHEKMNWHMQREAKITTCFGVTRTYLDRPSPSLLREMLSFEPQANTTFTTNVVINRLYYDELNKLPDGDLFIKLCNQVHDELDFIAPIGEEDRVAEIFYKFNDVPLSTWGTEFTIPFDAEYGDHWGNCETPLLNPYK